MGGSHGFEGNVESCPFAGGFDEATLRDIEDIVTADRAMQAEGLGADFDERQLDDMNSLFEQMGRHIVDQEVKIQPPDEAAETPAEQKPEKEPKDQNTERVATTVSENKAKSPDDQETLADTTSPPDAMKQTANQVQNEAVKPPATITAPNSTLPSPPEASGTSIPTTAPTTPRAPRTIEIPQEALDDVKGTTEEAEAVIPTLHVEQTPPTAPEAIADIDGYQAYLHERTDPIVAAPDAEQSAPASFMDVEAEIPATDPDEAELSPSTLPEFTTSVNDAELAIIPETSDDADMSTASQESDQPSSENIFTEPPDAAVAEEYQDTAEIELAVTSFEETIEELLQTVEQSGEQMQDAAINEALAEIETILAEVASEPGEASPETTTPLLSSVSADGTAQDGIEARQTESLYVDGPSTTSLENLPLSMDETAELAIPDAEKLERLTAALRVIYERAGTPLEEEQLRSLAANLLQAARFGQKDNEEHTRPELTARDRGTHENLIRLLGQVKHLHVSSENDDPRLSFGRLVMARLSHLVYRPDMEMRLEAA